ncbi:MAG: twin-arginine translocation signal domain-containing protein [Alphaproteobacteria bacterium]|nr:twin-arginine translocation signal domain-containing protein [Alphaproteobacteria bacterium]
MTVQTRRSFLGHLGAAAGVGLLAPLDLAHAGSMVSASADEAYLRRILRGLDVGAPFFADWHLVEAYPPMAGGVVLVLAQGTEATPVRVDVVRRAEPVRAPAATDHLELYAMDGGGGVRVMPEDLVEAMQALADHLEDNAAQGHLATRLLTHGERLRRYPAFMERAACELAPVPPEGAAG